MTKGVELWACRDKEGNPHVLSFFPGKKPPRAEPGGNWPFMKDVLACLIPLGNKLGLRLNPGGGPVRVRLTLEVLDDE